MTFWTRKGAAEQLRPFQRRPAVSSRVPGVSEISFLVGAFEVWPLTRFAILSFDGKGPFSDIHKSVFVSLAERSLILGALVTS